MFNAVLICNFFAVFVGSSVMFVQVSQNIYGVDCA